MGVATLGSTIKADLELFGACTEIKSVSGSRRSKWESFKMSTFEQRRAFECGYATIEEFPGRGCAGMPAMDKDEERAIRYRYRAEEVRALAVLGPDDKIRDALLAIVERYEAMAAALEPERKFG